MPNEIYSLLGISPEADEVRSTLGASQVHESPYMQSYMDYSRGAEEQIATRNREADRLALEADIARMGAAPTFGGQRARVSAYQKALEDAVYEKQAGALLKDLQALDPSDPEHESHQDEIIARHPISRKALEDPRVSNLIKRQARDYGEMQDLFDKDPDARRDYAALKTSGVTPPEARQQAIANAQKRADRLWFASQGGNPDEFDAGKFNGPDGRPDRAKMAFQIQNMKREQDSILSSTERKALEAAAEEFRNAGEPDVSDDGKIRAFKRIHRKNPTSEAEWQEAYRLAESAGQREREAVQALVEDLERAGKRVPEIYKKIIRNENVSSMRVASGTDQVLPSVQENPGTKEDDSDTAKKIQGSAQVTQPPSSREAGKTTVPDMRQPEQRDASSRLLGPQSGGLAVPPTSLGGPQNSVILEYQGRRFTFPNQQAADAFRAKFP